VQAAALAGAKTMHELEQARHAAHEQSFHVQLG
jgi:hypothetical protein